MEMLINFLRLLRWRMRRMSQWLRYRRLDSPVLFGNSFPKSGTHLLTQVLAGFSRCGPVVNSGLSAITMYSGTTGAQRSLETILGEIDRLRPGDVGYGHLHAAPEIVQVLCRDGVAPYFILRDPRDVAVSHVFYITEREPDHIHHHYYAQVLTSFDERLQVSIEGRPGLDFPFPNISARFEPYLTWLERPEVLTLRFEDFITQKEETLGTILDHAVARGFRYRGERETAVDLLSSAIDPQRSPTFRSGKVGAWKEHFTTEHKRLFKQVAGDLLVKLGYESDQSW
jgi:hypothetical protein